MTVVVILTLAIDADDLVTAADEQSAAGQCESKGRQQVE